MADVVRRHKLEPGPHRLRRLVRVRGPAAQCRAKPIVPCESSNTFLKSLVPSARWIDATALLYELRAVKTEQEIARLRVAQRVAAFGLEKFHESVAPGKTEAELAAVVYEACLDARRAASSSCGTSTCIRRFPAAPTLAAHGGRSSRPGRRRLRAGEIALLELAVCVDGFWADVTRVKVAGKPTALQQEVFAAVEAAQKAAMAAMRPGVEARVPHEAATEVLVEAGFEKYMVHLTGHGLGFRYHEPEPFLMPGNTMKLRAGHVCSVEPGLYGPGIRRHPSGRQRRRHGRRRGESDEDDEDDLLRHPPSPEAPMPETLLPGIAVTVLAGLIMGTSPWPLKLMRRFQYEHFAFVSMLVALVILPWAITLAFCPQPLAALGEVDGGVLLKANVFAFCWGIAQILAMLCFVRIGVSLTYGILCSIGAAVGVIVPMIVKASGVFQQAPDLLSTPGMIVMLGTLIMLVGVVLASLAARAARRCRSCSRKTIARIPSRRRFRRRAGDGGAGRRALGRLGIRLHL